MRFMILMIPGVYQKPTQDDWQTNPSGEKQFMPPVEMVEKMMKYNEELQKAGVLLSLDGLHPPESATRLHFAGGKPTLKDGPFTEAKEMLGGYWMIQVKSKAEAVEWAKRIPAQDGDVVEVRQVQEMADFSQEIQDIIPPELSNLPKA